MKHISKQALEVANSTVLKNNENSLYTFYSHSPINVLYMSNVTTQSLLVKS